MPISFSQCCVCNFLCPFCALPIFFLQILPLPPTPPPPPHEINWSVPYIQTICLSSRFTRPMCHLKLLYQNLGSFPFSHKYRFGFSIVHRIEQVIFSSPSQVRCSDILYAELIEYHLWNGMPCNGRNREILEIEHDVFGSFEFPFLLILLLLLLLLLLSSYLFIIIITTVFIRISAPPPPPHKNVLKSL